MAWETILIGAAVLAFCSALQSAVGFGFALFSVPAMLLLGWPLPESVVIASLGSFVQRVQAVVHLRRDVHWGQLAGPIALALLGLPLGVGLLRLLSEADRGTVRQILGGLILAVVVVQRVWRVRPRERLHRAWGWVAGFCSGILSGLASIGGPPLVLWVHAHHWPNPRLRVTIPAITIPCTPLQIALILGAFGLGVLPSLPEAAVFLPAIVGGTVGGLAMGHRMAVHHVRLAAYMLLLLLCATAILSPAFR